MSEQDFFRNALSDFTFEAASGGAIRHLADLGYTAKQISEQLTYPTPYERVRSTLWKRLLDTRVVLTQEPGSGKEHIKAEYKMERDKYGRTSFRLASVCGNDAGIINWKERTYNREKDGNLAEYLAKICAQNEEAYVYLSCDFGLCGRHEPEKFAEVMMTLNERQKEYITGLPWENRICYHRLDKRMQEIMVRLYEAGRYQGICYCLKTAEKIKIEK
ncbi:MAG: hypothetical protein K2L82_11850 [Lachnospiraceae bacterium]|nr:hypothetical protein [Lachnospiraceae bacterium]